MSHPFLVVEAAIAVGLLAGAGGVFLALMYGGDSLVAF